MFYLRFLAAMALLVAAFGYGILALLLRAPADHVRRVIGWTMGVPVLRVANLRVRITNEAAMTRTTPCVVIGNQQSVLCYCIYAVLFLRHLNSGIVARLTGQWNIPGLVWVFRRTGNFAVDPAHPMRTAVGYVQARRALSRGTNVWIGPEGTRSRAFGQLGAFKLGAFRLAIEAGVPVLPVVISPLKPRTDPSARRLDPNEVELRVLEPIETKGHSLGDAPALRDQARGRMAAALEAMTGVVSAAATVER